MKEAECGVRSSEWKMAGSSCAGRRCYERREIYSIAGGQAAARYVSLIASYQQNLKCLICSVKLSTLFSLAELECGLNIERNPWPLRRHNEPRSAPLGLDPEQISDCPTEMLMSGSRRASIATFAHDVSSVNRKT